MFLYSKIHLITHIIIVCTIKSLTISDTDNFCYIYNICKFCLPNPAEYLLSDI